MAHFEDAGAPDEHHGVTEANVDTRQPTDGWERWPAMVDWFPTDKLDDNRGDLGQMFTW